VPLCGSGLLCILIDNLIKLEIYSDYVQAHLAPSGYLKIPTDMEDYLKGCRFLPKLNNEIPSERNSTYKERFSSLENLVLIMVGSTRPDTFLVCIISLYEPNYYWNEQKKGVSVSLETKIKEASMCRYEFLVNRTNICSF